MRLKESENNSGITLHLYEALKNQDSETDLLIVFETFDKETRIRIFEDDVVEIKDNYLIRKTTENDYEILDLEQFVKVSIWTMED